MRSATLAGFTKDTDQTGMPASWTARIASAALCASWKAHMRCNSGSSLRTRNSTSVMIPVVPSAPAT